MNKVSIRSFDSEEHLISNVANFSNFQIILFFKKGRGLHIILLLNVLIYGVVDLILTYLILIGPQHEFNPIANYNFYLFLLVKFLVLGIIYWLMIHSERNLPGYILLFIGSVASLHNIGVLFF